MPRPLFLSADTLKRADDLEFSTQVEAGLSNLRFPQTVEEGIRGLRAIAFGDPDATEWTPTPMQRPDPLPIVVSPQPTVQPIGQTPQPAQPRPAAMPEQGPQAASIVAATPSPQTMTATSSVPSAAVTPTGQSAPTGDLRAYTRSKAASLGIDPDIAERVFGDGEGGFDDPVRQSDVVYQGKREESYGPAQLNMTGGLGTALLRERGIDVRDPKNVYAGIDYALEHAAKNGWGAFHGAARIGIGERDGIGRAPQGPAPARPQPTTPMPAEQTPAAQQQARNAYSPGNLTPNQINAATAEGLDYETALAVCGPAAAIAFARKTGRNPTMQEALGLARQAGWTAAQGMAGPASQQRLLQSLGVAARLQDGAPDWRAVAADVQRGNPVIVSTPGHYFVAERYDPDSGAFDFGNSAAVLKASGGRRWFRPEELSSLGMGEARASLFMDSPESPSPSVVAGRSPTAAGPTAAGSPTAPPTTGSGPPSPPAGGSGGADDLVTIRSNTGGTLTVKRSQVGEGPGQYSSYPKRGGYQIVDGGQTGDMQRISLAEPQPMPEDASDSERHVRELSEPTAPLGPPLRHDVPFDPATNQTGPLPSDAAETMSYRQPLGPTMGPDTGQGEYVDPDAGPRESGYTLPPTVTYNDPTAGGTQQQPVVYAPPPSYNDPTTTGTQAQPIPTGPVYGPPDLDAELAPRTPPAPVAPAPQRPPTAIQAVQNARAGMPAQEELAPRPGIVERATAPAANVYGPAIAEANQTQDEIAARNREKFGEFAQMAAAPLETVNRAVVVANAVLLATPQATADTIDAALSAVGLDRQNVGIDLPVVGRVGVADIVDAGPFTSIGIGRASPQFASRGLAAGIERGAGAAVQAGRELVGQSVEAAGRAGSRIGEALDANAERVAAADARMAAEGSTAVPGTLGQVPEQFGRPYPDIRRDVQGVVRESLGEPSSEMLADSRFPREAVHPDIRDAGIGPRITPQVDTSSRLNAGFGVVPDEGRALAPRRPNLERGSRGVADDMDTWNPLPDYGNPIEVLERDIGSHRREIARLQSALDGTGDPRWVPYAREKLPQYQADLADMERQYERLIGGELPTEPIPSRPTGSVSEFGSRRSDPLSAVNRVLGQGVASAVSGGVGAQVNQAMNPDDPNAAVKGFVAGALGPVAAARGARALARRLGVKPAALTDEALATLGNVPNTPQGRQIARNVAQQVVQQNPPQVINGRVVAASSKPPNLLELAQAYRHSFGLLGNVGTGLLNALGGPVEIAQGLPAEAIRMGLLRGYPVPVAYQAASLAAGLKEAALNAAMTAVGKIPQSVRSAPDFRPPLAERMQGPIGKASGYVLDTPGRLATQTPDAFWQTIFERWGRAREASNILSENGVSRLDPAAQVQELNRLLSNPTPQEAQRITAGAKEFADEMTYKGDAGYVEKALGSAFRPGGKTTTSADPMAAQVHDLLGSLVMPFYGSIFKIHKLGASRIPLVGTLADRSLPYDEKVSRQLVGLGLGIWAADRAAQGLVTGPGPDDLDEKARLKANGWDEWSTYIPGLGYVKSDNLASAGPSLKMLGGYYDAQRYATPQQQADPVKMTDAKVRGVIRAFEDFPVVQAMESIIAMAESPVKGTADLLTTVGSSFVPAVVRSGVASQDPYQRTTDPNAPPLEQIEQRAINRVGSVPGVGDRQDLPPALDRRGEPVPNPRQGIGAFIPQPKQPQPEDPIMGEMGRYGVNLDPARLSFTITAAGADAADTAPGAREIRLTPAMRQEWLRYRWQQLQEAAPQIQANPEYQRANDATKRRIWRGVVTGAERYADGMFKASDPARWERMIQTAPEKPVRRAS